METVPRALRLAAALVLSMTPICAQQSPPAGVIEGDVVDAASRQGISGVRVRLQCEQDEPVFVTTDEQGKFRAVGLKLKSCDVKADYPGYLDSKESAGRPNSPVVVMTYGYGHAAVHLELRRYGVITGKVTDAWGVAVAGAMVAALRPDGPGQPPGGCGMRFPEAGPGYSVQQCATTDDLGEFRLAWLPAASYYVVARPSGFSVTVQLEPSLRAPNDAMARPTFYPQTIKLADARPVAALEGKEARADVQLMRVAGVKVSGRISGSVPGTNVNVSLWPVSGNGLYSAGFTSADTFQAADLLPGKYIISAAAISRDDSSTLAPVAAVRRTIDIGTEGASGIELVLAPTPEIQGTVTFASGCTAVPIRVDLQADGPPRLVQVGPDGRFSVPHIAPGHYKVFVRSEASVPVLVRSARLADTEVLRDGFDVASETPPPLDITLGCTSERRQR